VVSGVKPKRVQRFGPELWERRAGHDWSLWDLWLCYVAVRDHGGELGPLGQSFADEIRERGATGGDASEAKLSHVRDLQARLEVAGLAPPDLADAGVLADKSIARRARDKVSGRVWLEDRARTPAMIDTPRRRFAHRARYGHWPAFPSDPAPWFEKFRPTVDRKGSVSKWKTSTVVDRLEKRLGDLDGPRRSLPDRLALYRAFHTGALELADRVDHSDGSIDMARTDAWLTYLAIDWREAGMEPDAYWRDLCELRLWEPYGLDYQHEGAWFGSARAGDVAVVEPILLALEQEHRDAVLDYPADEALVALADLHVAAGSRDRYVGAARRLGSRAWHPIETMARSQLDAGDRAGAVAVFEAADQPGRHQKHLREKCRSLTGVDLAAGGPIG
jgi:hypothetical protein